MKKSLYLTETTHSLVYKILILLLFFFFPPVTSIYVFQVVVLRSWIFLGPSSLEQKDRMYLGRTAAYHLRTFFGEELKLIALA